MKRKCVKAIKSEQGNVFPTSLVVLAIGSILVSSFITSSTSGLMMSGTYSDPIPISYTIDAGIEDAIWGLQYGTLADEVNNQGGQLTYTLPNLVNGQSAVITVSGNGTAVQGGGGGSGGGTGPGAVAEHDFEDTDWNGGSGQWLDRWYRNRASFTSSSDPYEGSYHIEMQNRNASFYREVDLSGFTGVTLEFYAKISGFESNDEMYCMVKGSWWDSWTTVKTWSGSDTQDEYQFVEIDLSPFEMTDEFYIAFISGMNNNNDHFFIDALEIIAVGGEFGGEEEGEYIAAHDFEDNNWDGGEGWLDRWWKYGAAGITSNDGPAEGYYHMQMRGGSYLDRPVNLSLFTDVHLQFYAKPYSFENYDAMYCYVSPDNIYWYEVASWDRYSPSSYEYYDIDLSSFSMTDEFWIVFYSSMSSNNDYFYIDDVKLVGTTNIGGSPAIFTITSTIGEQSATVTVNTTGLEPVILSWEND